MALLVFIGYLSFFSPSSPEHGVVTFLYRIILEHFFQTFRYRFIVNDVDWFEEYTRGWKQRTLVTFTADHSERRFACCSDVLLLFNFNDRIETLEIMMLKTLRGYTSIIPHVTLHGQLCSNISRVATCIVLLRRLRLRWMFRIAGWVSEWSRRAPVLVQHLCQWICEWGFRVDFHLKFQVSLVALWAWAWHVK